MIKLLFALIIVSSHYVYSEEEHNWTFLRSYPVLLDEKGKPHSQESRLAANLGIDNNFDAIDFDKLVLLTSNTSNILTFSKVSKNCEKFPFEMVTGDTDHRLVCVNVALFKEARRQFRPDPIFIKPQMKVQEVVQIDLNKKRVREAVKKLEVIKSIFNSPQIKPKIKSKVTYTPVFKARELVGFKSDYFISLDKFIEKSTISIGDSKWVTISFLGSRIFTKNKKYIASTGDDDYMDPLVSFTHDSERYHVFASSHYLLGNLRMFKETKEGDFVEIENSFKVEPAIYPKH